jgi:CRP/FNR family transcriptional regulator, anaerobic regulatory protein
MEKKSFLDYLQQFGSFHQSMADDLTAHVHIQSRPRRTILLEEGSIADQMYYMIKGAARLFTQLDNKEATSDIAIDGELFIGFESFVSRNPSRESIELLEDSIFASISYSDLQEMYLRHPELERIGRLIAERNYVSKSLHAHLLRSVNSVERYEHLLQNKPAYIQRIPLGILASYLGMSLENLSRVRKQIG